MIELERRRNLLKQSDSAREQPPMKPSHRRYAQFIKARMRRFNADIEAAWRYAIGEKQGDAEGDEPDVEEIARKFRERLKRPNPPTS